MSHRVGTEILAKQLRRVDRSPAMSSYVQLCPAMSSYVYFRLTFRHKRLLCTLILDFPGICMISSLFFFQFFGQAKETEAAPEGNLRAVRAGSGLRGRWDVT